VPTRKLNQEPNNGRKSAYVARNRVALIKAAQRVLAEQGADASIDTFAQEAEISVSTIYKHFPNKDALIVEAYAAAFHQWEVDSDAILQQITDPIEELVAPMRLFMRLKQTHPLFAAMSARNLGDLPRAFVRTEEGLALHIEELRKKKLLKFDNPEIRIRLISACLTATIAEQLLNPKSTEREADAAIEVILGILEIPEDIAHQVATKPLPPLPAT
jgi:AcrR family transcriptional regulator